MDEALPPGAAPAGTPTGTPAGAPAGVNVPEFSVTEIAGAIKRTLEGAFGRVRVRGEISGYKRHASGHAYFSLKDEGAKIDAVIWRSGFGRIGLAPEDGIEVIATGRLSTYADRSTYQLVVERLEYAGAGALLARIEALRARLLAEGLFAPERKRTLPLLPETIGVVTSEGGAVLHDIRTTLARRFPRRLLVWPVPVQGEGAAARIAAAIAGFDSIAHGGEPPRPDVLIVARGGGSLEDLMAFNDEAVVRAAAACRIPLISAVGHETDTTLIDFAADRRAPTPTAAAEMAAPARTDLLADLEQTAARLAGALQSQTQAALLRLRAAEARMPDLPGVLAAARQRLDDREERLRLSLPNLLAARRGALTNAAMRLPSPLSLTQAARQTLVHATHRAATALPSLLALRRAGLNAVRLSAAPLHALLAADRNRLAVMGATLESVSPEAVLARGYAVVLTETATPITSAAGVRPGMALRLRFADGEARATANGGRSDRQGRLDL